MLKWLSNNKEWVFSGVGIAGISLVFAFVKYCIGKLKKQGQNKGGVKVIGNQNIVGNGNIIKITPYLKKTSLSNVKIVDITLHEKDTFIVDIKLRNIGDQVAFVKEINFNVIDHYNMPNPQIIHFRLIEPSETYDVVFDESSNKSIKVSHSIAPNEVERIQLKIASSIAEPRMVTVYYLSLSVIYDEDNKSVSSEKYLWAIPAVSKWAGYYISHTDMDIAKKNYSELTKMNQYTAIKSRLFTDILKSYEKEKTDFLD